MVLRRSVSRAGTRTHRLGTPDRDKRARAGTPPAPAPGGPTFSRIIEQLLKYSLLIALLGYLLVTFRLNALGLPSTTWLGTERYLAMVSSTLYRLALDVSTLFMPNVAKLLLVVLVLSIAVSAFPCLAKLSCAAGRCCRHAGHWLTGHTGMMTVTFIFLITFADYVVRISQILTPTDPLAPLITPNSVIGPLSAQALAAQPSATPFYLSLLLLVFGALLYRHAGNRIAAEPDAFTHATSQLVHAFLLAAVLSVAICAIFYYGVALDQSLYRLVRVETSGQPAATNYGLLLTDADGVQIWQAVGGKGRILSLPKDQISSMTIGPAIDIRRAAAQAATSQSEIFPHEDFFREKMSP